MARARPTGCARGCLGLGMIMIGLITVGVTGKCHVPVHSAVARSHNVTLVHSLVIRDGVNNELFEV